MSKYEPFKCPYNPICNLVFQPKIGTKKNFVLTNEEALEIHIRIYHDASGKYIPESCDKCHLKFLNLSIKKQHSKKDCEYWKVNFEDLLPHLSLPESLEIFKMQELIEL